LEKKIAKKKEDLDKSRPDVIRAKEELEHIKKRVSSSQESYDKIKKEHDRQQKDIAELKVLIEHNNHNTKHSTNYERFWQMITNPS
jgi:predicted  nucleic acid-binding Zn-ribbon protein